MTTKAFALLGALSLTVAAAGCAPGAPDEGDWEDAAEGEGALRVCADGPTVKGIDVSYYQEKIDWTKVKNAGIGFAIVRLSYGEVFKDPRFDENWAGAKQAGLVRGAYQYFRPEQDPEAQAQLVIDSLASDPLGPDDLPIVLDVEQTDGLSATKIRQRMQIWLDKVEQGTGKRPIIYTAAFMQNTVGTGFSAYPLWVANYTSKCPLLPNGWEEWSMWQRSETGKVAGIKGNVDLDVFNGSMDDLLAFANNGAVTPADPQDPPADPQDPQDPPADPPATPTHLSPADGAHVTTDSVTMSCDPFAGAVGYTFDIQYYSAGSWKPYYTYTTSDPAKTFWPVSDAPYRFRVRAKLGTNNYTAYSGYSAFAYGSSSLP